MDSTLSFTTSLAQTAGQLLLDRFKISGTRGKLKPDRSVVTEADFAADHLITDEIGKQFPGETIISEELQPVYAGGATKVWVIDPLDGTTNYSLGLPFWGVSIARLIDGWPDTACVYFPMLDELYTAQRGMGAFFNQETLQLDEHVLEKPATFFSCCSRTFRRYHIQVPYKPRILGSAAYSFCCLARGIALLSFEATAKIWDIAGAWLVVNEAHGMIEAYGAPSPFPVIPGSDYSQRSFPTLAAATPELIEKAHRWIQPA
ncbi:MAG: inositol monophosphatase family protein [Omnitrophica WOR_2 bacterium]